MSLSVLMVVQSLDVLYISFVQHLLTFSSFVYNASSADSGVFSSFYYRRTVWALWLSHIRLLPRGVVSW